MEDYKQKYKDALERAKEELGSGCFNKGSIEYIFPELKESAGEKIRKALIDYFEGWQTRAIDENAAYYKDIAIKDILAWLEKQGEQKSADKVEPKFQNGQLVVWQNKCYKVNYNGCGYELIDQNGLKTSLEYGTVNKSAHLWTIQDAKDGDVLYSPCCKLLWIYKDEKTCYVGSNLNYNSGSIVINKSVCIPTDAIPATKEQRELLFKRMAENGYAWDTEKKETKLLISNGGDFEPELSRKKVTKKKVWSKEDIQLYEQWLSYRQHL